jgi:GNAT superfamily N-acetyltransferase
MNAQVRPEPLVAIEPLPPFRAIFGQLRALHRMHWDETEAYRDSVFSPRYDLLEHYFERGIARGWGAFHGEKLVGHVTVYVTTSVHTGEQIATEDALYVMPEYRRGIGARLIKRMLSDLKRDGVAELWATTRPGTRVGPLLERLGMKHVANNYHIRLGAK